MDRSEVSAREFFAEAEDDELERLWCRDLMMMMAGHFHKLRLTTHLKDIGFYGPSLAPLTGRLGKTDEKIVKALELLHKKVKLIDDVRGLGALLLKGKIGVIGDGDHACAMGGMF